MPTEKEGMRLPGQPMLHVRLWRVGPGPFAVGSRLASRRMTKTHRCRPFHLDQYLQQCEGRMPVKRHEILTSIDLGPRKLGREQISWQSASEK